MGGGGFAEPKALAFSRRDPVRELRCGSEELPRCAQPRHPLGGSDLNRVLSMFWDNLGSRTRGGIAVALGEITMPKAEEICRNLDLYSSVASCSSGVELTQAQIVLLGNRPGAGGRYRIGHALMRDAIDIDGIYPAIAAEAARRAITLPMLRDVLIDLKQHAHEEFIASIAIYRVNRYRVTLPLDWLLRHDLLPQNSSFYSCARGLRR
jgi:hypothetical protein